MSRRWFPWFLLVATLLGNPASATDELARDAGEIVAWGDSLTAGAGTHPPFSYSVQLEKLTGRVVYNFGIGGQTSTAIAARMNALALHLSVKDDEIPANAPIAVVARDVTPITNQGPDSFDEVLCDIPGKLKANTVDGGASYTYSFERLLPGTSGKPCPRNSIFSFSLAEATQGDFAILWMGRNGADPKHTVLADIAAAVAKVGNGHFLVGAIITGANDSPDSVKKISAENSALKTRYADHYVDLQAALAARASDTTEDANDIARHVTPTSLRFDDLHLNATGYRVVAQAFAEAISRLEGPAQ